MRKTIILVSMALAGIALCGPEDKKLGWRHVKMGQAAWDGVKGRLDKGQKVEFRRERTSLAVTNLAPSDAEVRIDTNTWERVKRTVDGYFPTIGDFTGNDVYLRNCLFKSAGTDDDNFISCKWGADPKFFTEREKYIFDYRLRNTSDAIAAGNRSLCPASARYDRYGQDRWARDGIDIGAYVWVPQNEE